MIKLLQTIYFEDLYHYSRETGEGNYRGFWKTLGFSPDDRPKMNLWTLRRIEFRDSQLEYGEEIKLPECMIECYGSFVNFEKIPYERNH